MIRKRFALAAALAAVVALLAVGSGVASACPTGTVTIDGAGSSLQRLAQERLWIPGYHALCTNVTVNYTANGSGEGLREWGAETGTERTSARNGKEYIATDDAPTATQIGNMERSGNGARIGVIPVAQAAISVFIDPPTGVGANCTIAEITNADLEAVFRHTIRRWREISTVRNAAECNEVVIKRVVRKDVSGTTFQLKHYLWLNNRERVEGTRSWLDLQGATTSSDNLVWPSSERSEPIIPANNGGGELIRELKANAGTIGYASITDAAPVAEARLRILRVLNGATFAEPLASEESNCATTKYRNTLGTGTEILEIEAETTTDWTQIYGSNPAAGGTLYPICTLTWEVAYLRNGGTSGYETAGLGGANIGTAVKEYVSYAHNHQSELERRHYGRLPNEILTGSRVIAGRIG